MLVTNALRSKHAAIGAVILLMGMATAARAQAPEPQTILPPTVEGDWTRTDPNGSGSFDGLTSKFKPAQLTPAGEAALAKFPNRGLGPGQVLDDKKHGIGQPVVVRSNVCVFNGGQLRMEYDSAGFHMVLGKNEATATQEGNNVRNIYLDGRPPQTAASRAPSSSGFSVGHIEPDGTLVVETTDMTPGRVTAGGVRSPETKVTERYIPSPDGKNLKIVFTWEDPKLYVKPHIYEYTFERMAPGSYALDDFCDATDPLWGQSIVPPPQK